MKEGKGLSSFFYVFGLLLLFQKATQMELDFLTLAAMALVSTLWTVLQMKNPKVRVLQPIMSIGIFLFALGAVVPRPPVFMAHYSVYELLDSLEGSVFKGHSPLSLFFEIQEYVINPEKTNFYHFQGLALVFILVASELIYRIHRHKRAEWHYLTALIVSGLLWFTYIDVWLVFSCFFTAYAIFRLTQHGKGFLFGAILPVVITLSAFLATAATPVNAINETLSQWRTESTWLRTATFFGGGGSGFELKQLGFYPLDQRLGGPVKLSKEVYFRIQTNRTKLYLRGRVLTTYNGVSWKQEESKPIKFKVAKPVATSRLEYMLYDFKEGMSTVLAPMSVIQTNLPQDLLTYDKNQILTYDGNLKRDYNDGVAISGYEYSTEAPPSFEPYLQLPPQYAPEVVALTKKITKGAKSDRDKVERIRRYLLSQYTYALAVGVPPKDKDFVAYFLLSQEEGYCVYFATASAVMARISGVPSRYVEGFITPETLIPGRDTPVSGERAHAWSEVFYDETWHILETTPTFTTLGPEEGDSIEFDALPNAENEPQQGKTEEDMTVAIAPQIDVNSPRFMSGSLKVSLALALLVLATLAVLWFKWRAIGRYDLKKRQGLYIYLLLAGLCDRYGISQPQALTTREILERSAVSSPSLGLLGLVEIIEKSLYDSRGCSDTECAEIEKVYWTLYHKHFNTAMKLKWGFKIAGKGRIFNGLNGKNSTA